MADMTTKTPASLIKDYILAHAPNGFLAGWEIKIGKLPAEPDQVIALIDQGGPAGFPHLLVDWPGLQILVRGAKAGDGYQTSYLKVRGLRDLILGLDSHPVEFPELDGVTERGHIVPLGYDEQDRHTWSSNYQLQVEPGANALTHRASL
jgi:hypothetical protein